MNLLRTYKKYRSNREAEKQVKRSKKQKHQMRVTVAVSTFSIITRYSKNKISHRITQMNHLKFNV